MSLNETCPCSEFSIRAGLMTLSAFFVVSKFFYPKSTLTTGILMSKKPIRGEKMQVISVRSAWSPSECPGLKHLRIGQAAD